MAESSKLKILSILEIMKKTDEFHPLNAAQIADKLLDYGITAERKSIVRDLDRLEDAGYSILRCENHNLGWYMTDHEFEDYEIKMLVDAVAAAKFLTIEDSRRLIGHIRTALATQEGERLIDATMVMDSAIKIKDRQFKHKFDTVLRAVAAKRQIRFQYQELAPGNQLRPRKQGYFYQVSPYFLVLNDDDYDEYFVIGNVSRYDTAAHFRVELMTNLEVTDQPIRPIREIEGLKEIGKGKTIADYVRETVHMWHGDVTSVTLNGINACRYHVIKRFGHDIYMQDDGEERFIARVMVTDGDGFYQWLASYGPNVTITAPEEMRVKYKDYLMKTIQNYE